MCDRVLVFFWTLFRNIDDFISGIRPVIQEPETILRKQDFEINRNLQEKRHIENSLFQSIQCLGTVVENIANEDLYTY